MDGVFVALHFLDLRSARVERRSEFRNLVLRSVASIATETDHRILLFMNEPREPRRRMLRSFTQRNYQLGGFRLLNIESQHNSKTFAAKIRMIPTHKFSFMAFSL